MLTDNIICREQIRRFRDPVLAGRHLRYQVAGIAIRVNRENVELHAGNHMLVQLILLEDLDAARRGLILNRRQQRGGIDIGTVHVHLPFLVGRMIAVGSAQLADGIAAIRDLRKQHRTVRLGGSLLNLGILRVKQTEDRAGQRLAVVLCLFQLHPIQIIPDHGIAGDLAIRCDGEGLDRYIQRVAGRCIGFLEGVGAGHNGNIGNLALAVGVLTVNGIAIRVIHLDQRAGQLFRAGDIRLGDRNRRIDQVIQDRILQIHSNHILTGSLVGTGQLHRILFRTQQPALGHRDFLHVVVPMREHTGEGQVALGIRSAGSHEGISRQLLIIAVGDDGAVVQPEHKALTGNHFNGLVNHAFLGFGQLQVFLFLPQRHADRQKGVGSGDLHLNDRGLLVYGRQGDVVGR